MGHVFPGGSEHSESLLIEIDSLLKSQNLKLDQVARLIASSGPGSFTGLRIALASLKAIAVAKNIPLDLVSSSESRALAFKRRHPVVKEFSVLTRIATGSYHFAELVGDQFREGTEHLKSTVLLDAESSREFTTSLHVQAVFVFPSLAEYLGETVLQCTSRQTFQTLPEIVSASPNYFGSSRF